MKQLAAELEAYPGEPGEKRALAVWFNPWRHEKGAPLWAAFAIEFLAGLKQGLGWRERLIAWAKLTRLRWRWGESRRMVIEAIAIGTTGTIGTWVLSMILSATAAIPPLPVFGAGLLAVVALLVVRVGLPLLEPIERMVTKAATGPDYHLRLSYIEHFHRDFASIVKAYAENRRIYVMIDDIDRAPPDEAADLMRSLNLLASTEMDLFFILGIDRDFVAASLAVEYEEMARHLDDGKSTAPIDIAHRFLDKFIHWSIHVPHPRANHVTSLYESPSTRKRA